MDWASLQWKSLGHFVNIPEELTCGSGKKSVIPKSRAMIRRLQGVYGHRKLCNSV